MLQFEDCGKSIWRETEKVVDVDWDAVRRMLTIRAEGGAADTSTTPHAAATPSEAAPLGKPAAAFAMTARLSLAPGRSDVLAEIVAAENLGDAPLLVERVFMRPYAAAAKPEGVTTVPKLWKGPHEGWWRFPDGRRFGAVSLDAASCSFRFYVSGNGVQHPDAPFVENGPFEIAPGTTWTPSSPMGALLKCE